MEGLDCIQIEVPLQKTTYKKIDSEKVREGTMKSTQYKEVKQILK